MLIAKGASDLHILPKMANRHGLIAGATGTGKTVSLQVMAEQFSALGVPVFLVDVKGDLSGISQPGGENLKVQERIKLLKLSSFQFNARPVTFWDVFGQSGHPLRSTISEMGPLLVSRLLNLNETQAAVLNLAFKVADDKNILLLDLKDLRSLIHFVGENAAEFQLQYGNVSAASIGAIQRGLLELESQGGEKFFGEPAICLDDFIQTDSNGKGMVNVLAADKLHQNPKLYSAFLLWLLSELYENLPEVGDLEKPKLVLFFDEAHLLFKDTPQSLGEKIEQVIRLIRSKGVGVYFITQNPLDIPAPVLGQLGNRVQHALRSFTPLDQKAVKAAAQTFRANPGVDVEKVISELEVGQALVSFLDEKGSPSPVEKAFICPPESHIGSLSESQRQSLIQKSVIFGHYEKTVDRESAFEILSKKASLAVAPTPGSQPTQRPPEAQAPTRTPAVQASMFEKMATSALRAASSQLGRSLIRGVLGSLSGGGSRRR